MESYQPPHHGYMRPPPPPPLPPPSTFDPQYPQHHHSYHHHHHQYPPPQQNQWGPPPPPAYPTHPHHSYPAPPQSYAPPPPPRPPYPNQDWGNGNWTHHSHHSGWEYPAAHTNEEDWATKAKAWASARSAMENQQPHSQYTSAHHQEDSSHYANQYPQPVESHFQDAQQTSVPTSGFSSYQGPVTPLRRPPPAFHQQEPTSVSSYVIEPHLSFTAKDVVLGGDSSAGFAHLQGQTNSSVHQQEVPSSYSSIQGNEHGNSFLPADDRVRPEDHAQFAYGNHSLHPMDQPLDFASRFSHGNDPKMMSSYPDSPGFVKGTDSAAAVSSLHTWTAPAEPGASYPPIAPAFPSALQHDHVGVPPLPGQHSPLFGTGPGFQPPFPTHVGLSAGAALHPGAAFSVDAYGVPLNSERPKKAAVPNWLREEIIKTKATIVSSAPEHFKAGSQSIEDELIDKPIGKDDQADSKSMDSARSTEEDDDEDEEDAQRTAVINQEIKRVLTEVLLKVTDELFNEIATKVLSEDDHSANAIAVSDDSIPVPKVSFPPPPVSAPKASAKVINPAKGKESEENASGETSSGSAGNVLGLANYASDEDDEIQASSKPKLNSGGARGAGENARAQMEAQEHRTKQAYTEIDNGNGRPLGVLSEYGVPASKLNDHRINKDLATSNDFPAYSGNTVSVDEKGEGVIKDAAKSTDKSLKETISGPDVPVGKFDVRILVKDNSPERGTKRHDKHDSKKSSSARDNYKETESNREREAEKDETCIRRDERHSKKDKTEDSKKERERDKKERSSRHGEKARESDSRKRSPHREGKDSKYERERDKKRSSKDDVDKKRARTKEEKNDKSRHKSSDPGRHKRRRSSSVGSPIKLIKESPNISYGSSDEVSEKSRRKNHAKKRNLSPSPVRSRQRDRRSRSPVRQHRR